MTPVCLQRSGRLVLASGPSRSPLHPDVYAVLADALTYYERKFDYTAGPGNNMEIIDRKIYRPGPSAHTLIFPIGLRSRVAGVIKSYGHQVSHYGGTLVDSFRGTPAEVIDWDGLFRDFNIYDEQQSCLAKVVASDGGIIASPTGTGKSVMMRMICRMYYKARIHVITKAAILADEIYTDLSAAIPGVGKCGGGKRDIRRVTVFVADSTHHGMGEADIVLLDEVHELLAPKYVEKLARYAKARIFGFSASPTGRLDNRDILGEAICGPILHEMSYQDGVDAGRIVPISVEWLRVPYGPSTSGITNPATKDKISIWQNEIRNRIIADRAKQFGPDEQVMIMVKTIDHAAHLRKMLPNYSMAYAANGMDMDRIKGYIKKGFLPADEPLMTADRLSSLRKQFADGTLKKVISNYIWGTGVNFKNLGVIIRADAAGSEIRDTQLPGRISRRIEGVKESALMIDCWDEWDERLLRKSQGRGRNYKKKGWVQVYSPTNQAQAVFT